MLLIINIIWYCIILGISELITNQFLMWEGILFSIYEKYFV